MSPQPEPPTDGVVRLRPWRDEDAHAARAGHDEEIAHWVGQPGDPPAAAGATGADAGPGTRTFVVEQDGEAVGTVTLRGVGSDSGRLSWQLYAGHRGQGLATRALRLLVQHAFTDLGLRRVEAEVEPENTAAARVATRAGLRREGVKRIAPGTGARADTREHAVYARLADDPPITEPESFRALLNSFLPRKRAIAQMLIRDPDERVLLCRLTYKQDWDLPGGVVEVHESPQAAVCREVDEELALTVKAGPLLLTDWLPSWSGWDDALCLVFDGGVHDPAILRQVELQQREIRDVAFCTPQQVRERAADFTARRIEAAQASLAGGGPAYTESGH
ncbi:MAG TPA: GNAT family N-acetyltransferase [Nocardioidaceae bacterium]|nr:GNAT family N-acetyltransferase [Nocardioidaceae bacterium]